MLIGKLTILVATVGLAAFAAIPSIAHDHGDSDDGDHKQVDTVMGGDFDLVVLDGGMVEASYVADLDVSISSIAIRSETLLFGPVQEVDPGVWIATASAPDGTQCYQAFAEVVLSRTSDSKLGDDGEREDDDRHKSRSDSDHHDKKKSRSHHDEGREDEDDNRSDASASYLFRMGASVCGLGSKCEEPVVPPIVLGPGPSTLPSLGLYR